MTPEVRGLFQGEDGPRPAVSRSDAAEAHHRRGDRHPDHEAGHHVDHLSVVVDCDRCSMRGVGCGDCVISVLLGGPPGDVVLDETERHAIDVLADAGLVPPLRMVESRPSVPVHEED